MGSPSAERRDPSYRPTWDATLRGLPMEKWVYDASLVLLRRFVDAGGRIQALAPCGTDADTDDASIALEQGGVIATERYTGQDFKWLDKVLTPYGRRYASERGIEAPR